jgi:hypothetical protein
MVNHYGNCTLCAVIQEKSLVECKARDSRTVDGEYATIPFQNILGILIPFHTAGTQTTLTFPMALDLEEMLAAMCHGQWKKQGDEGEEEESASDKDCNSSTLRRKLFGQPERLVSRRACSYDPLVVQSIITAVKDTHMSGGAMDNSGFSILARSHCTWGFPTHVHSNCQSTLYLFLGCHAWTKCYINGCVSLIHGHSAKGVIEF